MRINNRYWRRVCKNYYALVSAYSDFQSKNTDHKDILKRALMSEDRDVAIITLRLMPESDLIYFFEELVRLSLSQRYFWITRELIKKLPREWVLSNIEEVAEPLISNGDYFDYSMILGLYDELDQDLTAKLAKRAYESNDEDTKEVGEMWLEKLKKN